MSVGTASIVLNPVWLLTFSVANVRLWWGGSESLSLVFSYTIITLYFGKEMGKESLCFLVEITLLPHCCFLLGVGWVYILD